MRREQEPKEACKVHGGMEDRKDMEDGKDVGTRKGVEDWKGTAVSYWNERAGQEYVYKKEKFYTITPIPYYYARRRLVIGKVRSLIGKNRFRKICDFGCGDGEYIKILNGEQKEGLSFHGVDASSFMIERARERLCCDNVDFEISAKGITKEETFDMVYSSAIWAHVDDGSCHDLMKTIYDHLRNGGMFVICEQTAPYRFGGG